MRLGLLGRQPHRPAPDALGTEGEGRSELAAAADATGGQDRHGSHGIDDLGHEHHRADLAGVATGLRSLRDHEVHAGRDVADRVCRLAGERADLDAGSWARATMSGGGEPSAFTIAEIGCEKAISIMRDAEP